MYYREEFWGGKKETFSFSFLNPHLRIHLLIWERERETEAETERERETLMSERNIDGLPPRQQGTKPATCASALTRNRTHKLLVHGTILQPMSHTGQREKVAVLMLKGMWLYFRPLSGRRHTHSWCVDSVYYIMAALSLEQMNEWENEK